MIKTRDLSLGRCPWGFLFPFSSSGKEGCLLNNLTGGEEKRIDKLKEIVHGHGVWLSERAWVIAIVTIEALIAIFVIAVYNYAKAKFT